MRAPHSLFFTYSLTPLAPLTSLTFSFLAPSSLAFAARAATSADHKGEIITAIAQYKDAVAILEAEAAKPHKIPDEYLTLMTDRVYPLYYFSFLWEEEKRREDRRRKFSL